MAGANVGPRGPPPPPPVPAEGIIMVDGPQMAGNRQFRPQQQQPQQQQQQRNMPPMMMNNSTTVSDITPVPQMTEEAARRKLTIYEVYTLRKAEPLPLDPSSLPAPTNSSSSRRRSSSFSSVSKKPKPNWQRITITKDAFEQSAIISKIRTLDRTTKAVTSKKAALAPNQHLQVTKLVDEKAAVEFDPAFGWTLVQLERREVQNRVTGARETDALTLFLKRAPHANVNALQMWKSIEMARKMAAANANRPPQQQQGGNGGPNGGGGNGNRQGGNGNGDGMPMPRGVRMGAVAGGGGPVRGNNGGPKGPKIEIIDDRQLPKSPRYPRSPRGGGKKKFNHHSDSDSDYSLSDSDSDRSYDTDTSLTLSSSRSGPRRRRDSGLDRRASRHHEKGYVVIEDGNRRRRSSGLSYAPDAPRGARAPSFERTSLAGVGGGVDAITAEAFAAGVVAATKVAAAEKGPRAITYRELTGSERSFDDTLRGIREMRLRDEIEAQDDALSAYEMRERLRDEYRRDDLRGEDLIRRDEMRMRDAEERLRRDSMSISPRSRVMEYLPRGSLVGEEERGYGAFGRNPNPFARRESLRDRMDYRGYR